MTMRIAAAQVHAAWLDPARTTEIVTDWIGRAAGQWIVEPVANEERLVMADIHMARVREERHNFDPTGHYSRPDVLELTVHRRRLTAVEFNDR